MKIVSLSERDRGVLKACGINVAIGKASLEDLCAYKEVRGKLQFGSIPVQLSECSESVEVFELEDAELSAVKKVFEEGRERLSKGINDEIVDCWLHLNAAKPKDEPIKAKE